MTFLEFLDDCTRVRDKCTTLILRRHIGKGSLSSTDIDFLMSVCESYHTLHEANIIMYSALKHCVNHPSVVCEEYNPKQDRKMQEVHVLINYTAEEALNQVDQLMGEK